MPDAIPAENLRPALKFIVHELLESFCEIQKDHGIEVSIIDEKVEVSLSVIAPAGGNLITRRTRTTTGQEVTTSQTGTKISRDEEATSTSSQVADGYVSIGTVTKVDPESTTTRVSPFKTSKTVQESTPDVSVSEETQKAKQSGERQSFGSNTVTRTNQYDTV